VSLSARSHCSEANRGKKDLRPSLCLPKKMEGRGKQGGGGRKGVEELAGKGRRAAQREEGGWEKFSVWSCDRQALPKRRPDVPRMKSVLPPKGGEIVGHRANDYTDRKRRYPPACGG